MRENKFRATVIRHSGHTFFEIFTFDEINRGCLEMFCNANHVAFKDVIIGQFTGSKDKNCKEIYDDDRCNVLLSTGKTVKATVVEIDGCFELKFDEYIIINERNTKRDYLKCHTCNYSVEVIGTIHDGVTE